jgi:hypothetical protein
MDLAEGAADERIQTVALLAANAADGALVADRLFTLARSRNRDAGLRARALRWLSEAAGREGRAREAESLLRSVIRDEGDVEPVRDRAIRQLDRNAGNEAFLRESYRVISPRALKERILRILGSASSEQNATWLRGIITDRREAMQLRERALRVLGEDHRTFWPWLSRMVQDSTEEESVRDRAVRLLAEQGAPSSDLSALYDRVRAAAIRRRLIRILAERGDDAAVEKLIGIADRDADPEMRRTALRKLSETGNAKARLFLESRVLR